MVATRQLKRIDKDRWVYRTDRGDYGPVTTDGLLEAIAERKIELGTMISAVGTNRWAPAGDFALFRDHYELCRKRWARDELHREAELIGQRIESKQKLAARFWLLLALGVVVGGSALGWVVWRLSQAGPVGFERLSFTASVPALPIPSKVKVTQEFLPAAKERKVARLYEPESYDTAGVAIGAGDSGHVTQMHFSEDGEVQAISQAELEKVVASARTGLYACAREAALKSATFSGTEVGFTVTPGRITKIGVGAEARSNPAFQACVKTALARVAVPQFAGSERRVTVPLRIER